MGKTQEKLILKVSKGWGRYDRQIRVPEDIYIKIEDISKLTNIPQKYICAELIIFALERLEIVE